MSKKPYRKATPVQEVAAKKSKKAKAIVLGTGVSALVASTLGANVGVADASAATPVKVTEGAIADVLGLEDYAVVSVTNADDTPTKTPVVSTDKAFDLVEGNYEVVKKDDDQTVYFSFAVKSQEGATLKLEDIKSGTYKLTPKAVVDAGLKAEGLVDEVTYTVNHLVDGGDQFLVTYGSEDDTAKKEVKLGEKVIGKVGLVTDAEQLGKEKIHFTTSDEELKGTDYATFTGIKQSVPNTENKSYVYKQVETDVHQLEVVKLNTTVDVYDGDVLIGKVTKNDTKDVVVYTAEEVKEETPVTPTASTFAVTTDDLNTLIKASTGFENGQVNVTVKDAEGKTVTAKDNSYTFTDEATYTINAKGVAVEKAFTVKADKEATNKVGELEQKGETAYLTGYTNYKTLTDEVEQAGLTYDKEKGYKISLEPTEELGEKVVKLSSITDVKVTEVGSDKVLATANYKSNKLEITKVAETEVGKTSVVTFDAKNANNEAVTVKKVMVQEVVKAGETPKEFVKLSQLELKVGKSYKFIVEADGYRPLHVEKTLTKEAEKFEVTLESVTGSLVAFDKVVYNVTAKDTGAKVESTVQVLQDGKDVTEKVKESGYERQVDYVVNVKSAGYKTQEVKLKLELDTPTPLTLNVQLEKANENAVDYKDVIFKAYDKDDKTKVLEHTVVVKQNGVDVTNTVKEKGFAFDVEYEIEVSAKDYSKAVVKHTFKKGEKIPAFEYGLAKSVAGTLFTSQLTTKDFIANGDVEFKTTLKAVEGVDFKDATVDYVFTSTDKKEVKKTGKVTVADGNVTTTLSASDIKSLNAGVYVVDMTLKVGDKTQTVKSVFTKLDKDLKADNNLIKIYSNYLTSLDELKANLDQYKVVYDIVTKKEVTKKQQTELKERVEKLFPTDSELKKELLKDIEAYKIVADTVVSLSEVTFDASYKSSKGKIVKLEKDQYKYTVKLDGKDVTKEVEKDGFKKGVKYVFVFEEGDNKDKLNLVKKEVEKVFTLAELKDDKLKADLTVKVVMQEKSSNAKPSDTITKSGKKLAELKSDYEKVSKDAFPKEITQEMVDAYYDVLKAHLDSQFFDTDKNETYETVIVDFLAGLKGYVALDKDNAKLIEELSGYLHTDSTLLKELDTVARASDVIKELLDTPKEDAKKALMKELDALVKSLTVDKDSKKLDTYLSSSMLAHLEVFKSLEGYSDIKDKDKALTALVLSGKALKNGKITNISFVSKIKNADTELMKKFNITQAEIDAKLKDGKTNKKGFEEKPTTNGDVLTFKNTLELGKEGKIVLDLTYDELQKYITDKNTKLVIKTADGVEAQYNLTKLDLSKVKEAVGEGANINFILEKGKSGGVSISILADNGLEGKDNKSLAITNFGTFAKIIVPKALIGVDGSKTRVFRQSDSGNIAVLGKMIGDSYELHTQYGGTFIAGEPVVKKTVADVGKFYNSRGMQDLVERGILVMDAEDKFSPNRAMTTNEIKRAFVVSLADGNDASMKDVLGASIEEFLAKETGTVVSSGGQVTRENVAVIMSELIKRYDSKVYDNAKAGGTTPRYSDVGTISTKASESVATMQNLGIMTGKENSMFDPNAHVTKSQFTKIIGVTLNKLGLLDNEEIYR